MSSSSSKSVFTMCPSVHSRGIVRECLKLHIDSHCHKMPALCDDGEHRDIHCQISPSKCPYIPGYLIYILTTKGSIVSLGMAAFQISMTLGLKIVELLGQRS